MSDEPTVPFNLRARVERLEKVVEILATGLLLNEYGKDLCRHGVEAACKELSHNGDIKAAISEYENS
jgi:hypothetical protein